MVESVLTSAESIITYRRRYRDKAQVGTVLDLLVLDEDNPRSLAFQLVRLGEDLQKIPGGGGASGPGAGPRPRRDTASARSTRPTSRAATTMVAGLTWPRPSTTCTTSCASCRIPLPPLTSATSPHRSHYERPPGRGPLPRRAQHGVRLRGGRHRQLWPGALAAARAAAPDVPFGHGVRRPGAGGPARPHGPLRQRDDVLPRLTPAHPAHRHRDEPGGRDVASVACGVRDSAMGGGPRRAGGSFRSARRGAGVPPGFAARRSRVGSAALCRGVLPRGATHRRGRRRPGASDPRGLPLQVRCDDGEDDVGRGAGAPRRRLPGLRAPRGRVPALDGPGRSLCQRLSRDVTSAGAAQAARRGRLPRVGVDAHPRRRLGLPGPDERPAPRRALRHDGLGSGLQRRAALKGVIFTESTTKHVLQVRVDVTLVEPVVTPPS